MVIVESFGTRNWLLAASELGNVWTQWYFGQQIFISADKDPKQKVNFSLHDLGGLFRGVSLKINRVILKIFKNHVCSGQFASQGSCQFVFLNWYELLILQKLF